MASFPVLYSSVLSYERWGQHVAHIVGGISGTYLWPKSTWYDEGTLWAYGPGRVFMCTQSGTSGASDPSINSDTQTRYVANDIMHSNSVTWGSAVFVDVTGYAPLGWDACVGSTYTLLEFPYPSMISPTVRSCFQGGGSRKVFIDSESTIVTGYSTLGGILNQYAGLHLHRKWDVTSEVHNTSDMWSNAAMSNDGEFVEYVSVDRESPTYAKKRGAKFDITVAGAARGYAHVEGMDIYLRVGITFGNFTGRNICNMWFEDCVWYITGHLTCTWSAITGGFAELGVAVDVVFSHCELLIDTETTALREMRGRWSFEKTSLSSTSVESVFSFSYGFFEIDFKGCDFSGCNPAAPLFGLRTATAGGTIRLEECKGVSRASLPDNSSPSISRYVVEVSGGWLDGEYDPFRLLRISDLFTMERTRETYRYSAPKQFDMRRVSDRYATAAHMAPKQEFARLNDYQIAVPAGAQELCIFLLLPDGDDPDAQELWGDVSYPGTGHTVGILSSLDEGTTVVLGGSSAAWEAPAGYVAKEWRILLNVEEPGYVLITMYCAWASKVFYVCPGLRSRILES